MGQVKLLKEYIDSLRSKMPTHSAGGAPMPSLQLPTSPPAQLGPRGASSGGGSEAKKLVQHLEGDWAAKAPLFDDDAAFIREVVEGEVLAPDMQVQLELDRLRQKYEAWNKQFKERMREVQSALRRGHAGAAPGVSISAHRQQHMHALVKQLGIPHLLQMGLDGSKRAKVFSAQSSLTPEDKSECMRCACQSLSLEPEHMEELWPKRHTQLQLHQLLNSPAGRHLVSVFKHHALGGLLTAGMHVAAFEVVFSQHNVKPKPHYKGHYIHNKLSCHHQDLRENEPWFDRPSQHKLPGSLRLVFDISPEGQRWFEFRLLHCGPKGMWLDELLLLQVQSDLVAFDALAAGSGGFFNPAGSRIFHARRSSSPGALGVSVVADVVVTAGLDGRTALEYSHTPVYRYFHG